MVVDKTENVSNFATVQYLNGHNTIVRMPQKSESSNLQISCSLEGLSEMALAAALH
jgi:hypothetical protein